jgi:hypothetical protein
VSSTKLILIFLNVTLSNFLILEQHKIDTKKPKKMEFISSTKNLEFKWDGHFVVILVSLVSRSIPVFYFKMLLPEQHETKHCGEGQMRARAPGIENTSRLILTKEAAR